MLSSVLQEWEAGGRYLTVAPFDHRVYCRQFGNESAAPDKTLLLLHGFPESSFSWHKIIDGMQAVFERVVVFDMLGYGFSDKPADTYGYSLFEQADVALQVWRQLNVSGGHLVAHDMGDSVATELVARHVNGTLPAWFQDGFQSLTFTNGSMVLELADVRITQKLLLSRLGSVLGRLFNYRSFRQQVLSAHGNRGLDEDDIRLLWDNILLQDGQRKNHLMIRYLLDRRRFEKTRWLPSLNKVELPIHLCWGEADAVARVAMAHYLKQNVCPAATLTLMPGVGHFCQLSDPGVWVESVSAFYRT